MWHVTHDMWQVTSDMGHFAGGEHSLKISAPLLLRFVIFDILKIWRKRLTDWLTELIDYKGVCKTALPTLGLLNSIIII